MARSSWYSSGNMVLLTLAGLCFWVSAGTSAEIEFIDRSFENASPLYWETDANGVVNIHLLYDHERGSINRATLHWHFAVEAAKGSEVTLVLHNFDNYWNGKLGSPIKDNTISVVSVDGKAWKTLAGEKLEGNRFALRVKMEAERVYVARVEPYRLSDLESLKSRIVVHRLVEIETIGKTVEGRDVEIIRLGNPKSRKCVLLRARAHPWESGGNWVVQGLIERLLVDDDKSRRWLGRYCVYVMPMANKDGVARGGSRFNMLGMDLNRKWDLPADGRLAPENVALEKWLESMIGKGRRPNLAIDLHNDSGGNLHVSRPQIDLEAYLAAMVRFEAMLREHSWFTEGSTGSSFSNPGTFGEGLLERYSITACVLELNANWIAGLEDHPSGDNWELFGEQLCEVFYHYFGQETGK